MREDDDILRYDRMVESALRGVVRQAISEIVERGRPVERRAQAELGVSTEYDLPGDHHFYLTFLTDYPGVKIPDYLHDRYPGEMTIVMQYQFFDLSVDEEKLSVTLSFNNVPERLIIPLSAISIFADPSVNFALQFQPLSEEFDEADLELEEEPEDDNPGGGKKKKKKKTDDGKTGEVVSLDQFRKK